MDDIAIVGYGAMLPEAEDAETFWHNLLSAHCSIREIPDEIWERKLYFSADPKDIDKSASSCAAFIEEEALVRAAQSLGLIRDGFNRLQIMALAAAEEALSPLRLPPEGIGRTAIYLGCMSVAEEVSRRKFVADEWASLSGHVACSCPGQADQILSALWGRIGKWSPHPELDRPHLYTSSVLSLLQERFRLPGEAALVDAACASSLAAIDLAIRALRSGRADFAVTGGIDANLGPGAFALFTRLGALAPERCLPFDRRSTGLSQGEGAVILALERLSDAERLGHEVHAIIKGCGGSSDGRNSSLFAPTVDGQLRAFHRAYGDMEPREVDYVECHGTGTTIGDTTEMDSVKNFFGESRLPIGSVKALLGHTKGAAGAVSLLKCLLSLKHRTLPPSPYCNEPMLREKWGAFVNCEPIKLREEGAPLTFGVSSFGFGGINYHLILQERIHAFSIPTTGSGGKANGEIVLVGQWHCPTARDWDETTAMLRMPHRSVSQIDKTQLAALAAVVSAFNDLHIDPNSLDRSAVSVISASTLGLELGHAVSNRVLHFELGPVLEQFGGEITSIVMAHKAHLPTIGEDSAPGSLNNVIAGRVANYFDFTGLSFNIDADLASFPAALRMAELLLADRDGLVILLASDEAYDPEHFAVKCGGVTCWLLASLGFAKKYDLPIESLLSHLVHSSTETIPCN
jgi:acyl transferase domain-containing protein